MTLGALPPPYPDYRYFTGHESVPFEIRSTAFSLLNAWWLAEASTLAYAGPDFVRPRFQEVGLGDVHYVQTGGTHCYVAANDRFAIVCFRGSEVSEQKGGIDVEAVASDFLTDADFWMSDWNNGGKVHRGFKKALDDIWNELTAVLSKVQARGCSIWMTGHSLGAALATLAGDRFENTHAVYTFGSPRVGNAVFRDHYKPRCYRIVHNRDIVARIPPPVFYRHVGEIWFIDGQGKIHHEMGENGKTDSRSDTLSGHEDSIERGGAPDSGLVPDAIHDHVPLFYAVLLWNCLAAERSDE